MGKNEGSIDRMLRVAVAVVALGVVIKVGIGSGPGIAMVVVAVIMLATAAIGFCPLYRVFGLSTAPKEKIGS